MLSLRPFTVPFSMYSCGTTTLAKYRSLKFIKGKFQGSPDVINGLCGSFTDSHPIIFCWANLKGGSLNLVKLFDQARHLSWRSPQEFNSGFACDSMLASFLNSPGNTFDLRRGDKGSLVYLAYISPLWLPMPSSSGPKYTHYLAHRVLQQFGFDQDIPLVFKDIVLSLPSLDPFLRLQAFSYLSQRSSQFMVPNSQRGVFTSSGFASYQRRVQKSFSDYVGSGKIGRVLDPSILFAPTSNRRLTHPTAGIVFAVIGSKTGFVKWHASSSGQVCYAQDFPEAWSRCDLFVGTSFGVTLLVLPLLQAKVKRKKSYQKLSRESSLKKVLRELKLVLRLRKGRLQNPRNNWSFLRNSRDLTPLQLKRKLATLYSQRSE